MAKVVTFSDSKISENNFLEVAGRFYKVSIANVGTTKMWVGKKISNTKPNVELPAKPDGLPAYSVVFSTDNPEYALGNDIACHFDGGTGSADIVSFETAREIIQNNRENIPTKVQ